jgi:TetR/AcrR family transcriptional regulator, regulator of cefoperazone and chloramphenicol sensitivity
MCLNMRRNSSQPAKAGNRSRRPAISDPTREKLLDTAGRIFADRGYQAATVREICDAAGENVAAIHYHFGDKLGLYTQVVQQSMQAAEIEGIRNALNLNSPPQDILRAVIRARLRSIERGDLPDWHFRILIHEMAQPTPVLRQLINEVGTPLFQRLLTVIGGMIGLPPDDDKTRMCALSVMGQILAYVFAAPLLAGVWPELKMTPEQVDRIADHIGDFSLAYIQNFRRASIAAAATQIPTTTPKSRPRK